MEIVERGFVKLQALWRGYAARQRYQKLVRENAYRKKVAKELLETERVYVENLDACIAVNTPLFYIVICVLIMTSFMQVYKNPLEENSKKGRGSVISESDFNFIFSDLEIVISFNKKLLAKLEDSLENLKPSTCFSNDFMYMVKILSF